MSYQVLGHHGLRVAELLLRAGSSGTRWGHGAKPGGVRRIVDRCSDAGGNFIDIPDSYEFGAAGFGKAVATNSYWPRSSRIAPR
jgi:aryl-alcohol dehydrogenase-like predicted oxidoreductase